MDRSSAQQLALDLMNLHRLTSWSFAWSNHKKTLGQCSHGSRVIRLSIHYVDRNPVELVKDTILHEIAHALVGPGHGHGRVWKAKCREVGAMPQRCSKNADLPEGRYLYIVSEGPRKGEVVGSRHRCPDGFTGFRSRQGLKLTVVDTQPHQPNHWTRLGGMSQAEYAAMVAHSTPVAK